MISRGLVTFLVLVTLITGCGRPAAVPPVSSEATSTGETSLTERSTLQPDRAPTSSAQRGDNEPDSPPFWNPETAPPADLPTTVSNPHGLERAALETRQEVNAARVAAAGIRKIQSERLVLYTDLPESAEVDGLPAMFDQAYPVWRQYFNVTVGDRDTWRLTGYLIKDKERFLGAGLFPDNLPPFANGFSRGYEIWLYEQPSDYYRRHLLLHEGTHGFMFTRLQASAPPWFMEGIAELLATHRVVDGQLQMNYFPRRREEVPLWGRIKILQDDYKAGRGQYLAQVFDTPLEAHLRVDAYGWCWGAAALLDGHPKYRARFRNIAEQSTQPDFAERVRAAYDRDWRELSEEWQVFVANLEYGYDLERMAIDFRNGDDLPAVGGMVEIAADRGWQSTGYRLQSGQPYRIRAAGRYQIDDGPQIWLSEPGGVSIRYYQGRPLGMLLAAIRYDDSEPGKRSGLLNVAGVGLESTLTPSRTGTLYLRINDSAAELSDNVGALQIEIVPDSL